MKLEELGEVYLESARKLDEIINCKKQELKVAKRKGDLQNIYFLQRDIKTLKDMKHDCLVTGQYLKNYYKDLLIKVKYKIKKFNGMKTGISNQTDTRRIF